MENQFNFGEALEKLKGGYAVSRAGWNGKGMWLLLQRPDENSKMTVPYIYMKDAQDQLWPWTPSMKDIFAEDWILV